MGVPRLLLTVIVVVAIIDGLEARCNCGKNPSCFKSVKRSRPVTCYAHKQVSYTHHWRSSCGFSGWDRCPRSRTQYRYVAYRKTCSQTYYERVCCYGYSNHPSCGACAKHPHSLSMKYCPKSITVQAASGKKAKVHWASPRFSEARSCPVSITGGYGNNMATLSCGKHPITYTGSSSNNNRKNKCAFSATVVPEPPIPYVVGKSTGETIKTSEGVTMSLLCKVDYGSPSTTLTWFTNNKPVKADTVPTDSGCAGYYMMTNTLKITFKPEHHKQRLTCKNNLGQSTHVDLSVWYKAGPTVTSCPDNRTLISSDKTVLVSWKTPTFSDPLGKPLKVTSNLPKQSSLQKFGWGHHEVIYTARNPSNGLHVNCIFTIVVKPKPCPSIPTPVDGALVCGLWEDFTNICMPMCPGGSRFKNADLLPHLFTCGRTGGWSPKIINLQCLVSKQGNEGKPSKSHFYSGQCPSSATQTEIKQAFMGTLDAYHYKEVCYHFGCEKVDVSVICGK